jgi:hypothetical protein
MDWCPQMHWRRWIVSSCLGTFLLSLLMFGSSDNINPYRQPLCVHSNIQTPTQLWNRTGLTPPAWFLDATWALRAWIQLTLCPVSLWPSNDTQSLSKPHLCHHKHYSKFAHCDWPYFRWWCQCQRGSHDYIIIDLTSDSADKSED